MLLLPGTGHRGDSTAGKHVILSFGSVHRQLPSFVVRARPPNRAFRVLRTPRFGPAAVSLRFAHFRLVSPVPARMRTGGIAGRDKVCRNGLWSAFRPAEIRRRRKGITDIAPEPGDSDRGHSEPGFGRKVVGGGWRDWRSFLCSLRRKFPVTPRMYRDFARLAGFRGGCSARNPRFVRGYPAEFPASRNREFSPGIRDRRE